MADFGEQGNGMEESEMAGATEVKVACLRSLASQGARLCISTRCRAGNEWTRPTSWEVGVCNPQARRVDVQSFATATAPTASKLRALADRYGFDGKDDPWAGKDDNEPVGGGQRLMVGSEMFLGDAGWYGTVRDRWVPDALWALEAAQGIEGVEDAGQAIVGDESCRRFKGYVRPSDIAGKPGIELVVGAGAVPDYQTTLVDIAIDRSGLVRRVACAPTVGRRFKPGLLFRALAPAVPGASEEIEAVRKPAGQTDAPWTVTEFWDYGSSVTIDRPTDVRHPGSLLGSLKRRWGSQH
jgi:hypothetical protein